VINQQMHIYEHVTGHTSINKCALVYLYFKYTTFFNVRTWNTLRFNVAVQLCSQPLSNRLFH